MAIFDWQRNKVADATASAGDAEEIQKKLERAASVADEIPQIKERLSALDRVTEFIDEFKNERERDRAEKAKSAAAAKAAADSEAFGDLIFTDPQAAINKAIEPTQLALINLKADGMRREIFEDTQKYKYYHGSIKSEVDKLIAAQPVTARVDPSVIENAYLTVVGRHADEIIEGKLKSRFSGAESSSRGTASGSAGDRGSQDSDAIVITDDIKKIAKGFGITPEDYAEMLKNEGVGYV